MLAFIPELPKHTSSVDQLKSKEELKSGGFVEFPWKDRERHTTRKAWFVLTKEVAELLASIVGDLKTLEVGCGTGYLIKQLRNLGCKNIKGIDANKLKDSEYFKIDKPCIKDIIYEDATQQDLSEYDIIISTWADYGGEWIESVVENLKVGQVFIYQGESQGGCVGTDRFFDLIENRCEELFDISEKLNDNHLQFWGINDYWAVYKVIK